MLKKLPTVGEPNNFCLFNGRPTLPRPITRLQAASALREMRARVGKNDGLLSRNAPGHYTLRGMNTLELRTR